MRLAATLAAAQYSSNTSATRSGMAPSFNDSTVDVLINVLREMESKKLIGPGFAPK